MERELLSKFIQDTVNGVVRDNKPYDDSTKNWLRRYGEMEQLDQEEINTYIDNLELFFKTLEELKTSDSKLLEDVAKLCGQNCTLSESETEALISEAKAFRNNSIVQMNAETKKNKDAIRKANEQFTHENTLLSDLNNKIQDLQNTETEIINKANQKAFAKIQQQCDKEHALLEESEKRVLSEKNTLNAIDGDIKELREKTEKTIKKTNFVVAKRKKILHHILLIALAIFLSLAEFLFIQEKSLFWVPFILNTGFVLFRLLKFEFEEEDFNCKPEFLTSMAPLLLMFFEVFYIDFHCERKLLLSFFILIPTIIPYIVITAFIDGHSKGKTEAVHHILLVTLVIITSLAEFFTFGNGDFNLFEDGWGWAFIPLVVNFVYVHSRVLIINKEHKECPKYEYLWSLIVFTLLTTVAYCTHNTWKLVLIPLGAVVILFDYLSKDRKQRSKSISEHVAASLGVGYVILFSLLPIYGIYSAAFQITHKYNFFDRKTEQEWLFRRSDPHKYDYVRQGLPEPKPITGSLSVDSKPQGAVIKLDGKRVDLETPAKINGIEEGKHTVSVKRNGVRIKLTWYQVGKSEYVVLFRFDENCVPYVKKKE